MKLSGRSARRIMMFGLAAVGAISGFTAQASEDYPNRPVRVLVGFAAGGATDLIARTVAQGSMPFCVEVVPAVCPCWPLIWKSYDHKVTTRGWQRPWPEHETRHPL